MKPISPTGCRFTRLKPSASLSATAGAATNFLERTSSSSAPPLLATRHALIYARMHVVFRKVRVCKQVAYFFEIYPPISIEARALFGPAGANDEPNAGTKAREADRRLLEALMNSRNWDDRLRSASGQRAAAPPMPRLHCVESTGEGVMTESEVLALVQDFLAALRGQATPEQTMAWKDFYHRYDPLVVRFARKCERQPVDADDLRQEIWIALAQSLLRLELDPIRGSLRQWLFGVARRARGKYRHRGSPLPENTQDPELLDDLVDPASAGDNDTDRQLPLERVREIALHFAATLPRRNERIVVACWIEGRSRPQVAAELGLSEKCVGPVLHRAKGKIRRMVAPECVDRQ